MSFKDDIQNTLVGPDDQVLVKIEQAVIQLDEAQLLELMECINDDSRFEGRLPLRLRILARISETAGDPHLIVLALVRLLWRLGSRKDLPDFGHVPNNLPEYALFMEKAAFKALGECPLSKAAAELGHATLSQRHGDFIMSSKTAHSGLKRICEIPEIKNPTDEINLKQLVQSEVYFNLMQIAADSSFREGNSSLALQSADEWIQMIDTWEKVPGKLDVQRFFYNLLMGDIRDREGNRKESLNSYKLALEHADSDQKRAYSWHAIAEVEKKLGHKESSWNHMVIAVETWLKGHNPQLAERNINWLENEADTPDKKEKVESLRYLSQQTGVETINRYRKAMIRFDAIIAELRKGSGLQSLVTPLDDLIDELIEIGAWPDLVYVLPARAVVESMLDEPSEKESFIDKAREIIESKLSENFRSPALFFVENAHALVLRNMGNYEEAFRILFEHALDTRKNYPENYGPEEKSTVEALHFLGTIAGHDQVLIEEKVNTVFSTIA